MHTVQTGSSLGRLHARKTLGLRATRRKQTTLQLCWLACRPDNQGQGFWYTVRPEA